MEKRGRTSAIHVIPLQSRATAVLTVALLTLFLLFSHSAAATVYYIDATSGSDSNDGLTTGTAWKTLGKVHDTSVSPGFSPGDQILLKRGETWVEELELHSSGTSSAQILLSDYGTAAARPKITSLTAIPDWNTGWTLYSGSVWQKTLVTDPRRMWTTTGSTESECLRAGAISSVTGAGRWYWASNVLYLYSTSDPGTAFSNMKWIRNTSSVLRLGASVSWITVEDLSLEGGGSATVTINGDDITLRECSIGWSAGIHGILGYGDGSQSLRVTIENCTIDSGDRLKHDFEYGCPNDGVRLNYGCESWTVRDNTITDWGHTGVNLTGDDGYPVQYCIVRNNTISSPDVDYCRGLSTAGKEGTCQFNELTFNLVVNTQCRNQFSGNENLIAWNVIDTVTNVVHRTAGTGQGISLEGYVASETSGDVVRANKIYNNTILHTDEPGIAVWGYTNAGQKYDNKLYNNAMFDCGRASKDGRQNIGIWIQSHASVLDNEYKNNSVDDADTTNTVSYRGTIYTVSNWNSADTAGDTIEGNQAYELYNDTASSRSDYRPSLDGETLSSLVNAGLAAVVNEASEDFHGSDLPQGGSADMGAAEYLSVSASITSVAIYDDATTCVSGNFEDSNLSFEFTEDCADEYTLYAPGATDQNWGSSTFRVFTEALIDATNSIDTLNNVLVYLDVRRNGGAWDEGVFTSPSSGWWGIAASSGNEHKHLSTVVIFNTSSVSTGDVIELRWRVGVEGYSTSMADRSTWLVLSETSEEPTPTPTGTATTTATSTPTFTPTPTYTATPTATQTGTSTPTATSTGTPTSTATNTATPTNTGTATPTFTQTPTFTPTETPTPPTAITYAKEYRLLRGIGSIGIARTNVVGVTYQFDPMPSVWWSNIVDVTFEHQVGDIIRVNDATEFYYLSVQSGTRVWTPFRSAYGHGIQDHSYDHFQNARPRAYPFIGRGDLDPIQILSATGSVIHFDPASIRVETEGGTKTRWPALGEIAGASFDTKTRFAVSMSYDGYGEYIVPLHRFTFPYRSHNVIWYYVAPDPDVLPPLDIPPEEPSWP